MQFKRNLNLTILLVVILLGSFLRLYKLDKCPPSLFGDEVDVGYQAYSILKTGKDYLGQSWPLSFHSLADWRTPLFLYSTVPFVAAFGLSEWAVRLPPALFGIVTIPAFFLLVRKLFKNDKLGLLSAFFLAISMWHLQYSRAAFEVTEMLFLLIFGLYLFLKALESKNYLIPSAVLLALTIYSYNTPKFFIPFFVILLVLCFRKQIAKFRFKHLFIAGLVFAVVCLPMAYDIFFGKAADRFSILSIFTDPTTVPQIGFRRLEDLTVRLEDVPLGIKPTLSSRIFHNKYLSWGTVLLTNYFRAFSTEFLFISGDINYRHSVQGGFGELYWLDALFLLVGVYLLFRVREKTIKTFLFVWLLLAPAPSALTRDGGNHATRLILMLPPLLILISYGAYGLITSLQTAKQKVVLSSLFSIFCFLSLMLYLHRYYVHWPLDSQQWWHPGFKQAAVYTKENSDKYNKIVWSTWGEPPIIFFLFWTGFNPRQFQKARFEDVLVNDSIQAKHLVGTKYYFGAMNEQYSRNNNYTGALGSDILYIAPRSEIKLNLKNQAVPTGLTLLEIVESPSGDPAIYILSGK